MATKLFKNAQDLAYSNIVANSAMNRERVFEGFNSYSKELNYNLKIHIIDQLKKNNHFSWIDLCCGKGIALLEISKILNDNFDNKLLKNLSITGIDLIDDFVNIDGNINFLKFVHGNLPDNFPDSKFNLITCVHGLHYIGDKLNLLTKISLSLLKDGIFIGNIDHSNIKSTNGNTLSGIIKKFNTFPFKYSKYKHILNIYGNKNITGNYKYIGAAPAGKNYTYQDVIDSFYI